MKQAFFYAGLAVLAYALYCRNRDTQGVTANATLPATSIAVSPAQLAIASNSVGGIDNPAMDTTAKTDKRNTAVQCCDSPDSLLSPVERHHFY